MDKRQALKELEQIHYAEILVEDEFIPLDNGTKIKNKIFDIGDTFGIHIPITTFQPNPNYPKGPLPNHTEDCLTGDMNYDIPCDCWNNSYTGISIMDVVDLIAHKNNIQVNMVGRGFKYREQLKQLQQLLDKVKGHDKLER